MWTGPSPRETMLEFPLNEGLTPPGGLFGGVNEFHGLPKGVSPMARQQTDARRHGRPY
jgi:hypothetical protein